MTKSSFLTPRKPHTYSKLQRTTGILLKRPIVELIEEVSVDDTLKNKSKLYWVDHFTFFLGPDGALYSWHDRRFHSTWRTEPAQDWHFVQDFGVDIEACWSRNSSRALWDAQLPVNPHHLQPPLDGTVVREIFS
jgi:hypothetical protein